MVGMSKARADLRWHVGALALYIFASFIFLDHNASLKKYILGFGEDPGLVMWFLEWWPWSIAHHLNPLYTNFVWQPLGLNFAWTTNVPLLALLGLPFTLLVGPVFSYNLLTLLAPVLSAWAAYFLCLKISRSPAAALAGGYLFGFSSYEMAETLDHLNLDFTAFIPLLVLLCIMRVQGELSRPKAVLLLSFCMAGQFLISTEISATAAVFGVVAWVISLGVLRQYRAALSRLAVDACMAGLLTAIFVSPLLLAMFMGTRDLKLPLSWVFRFSNDLISFAVPTLSAAFGGLSLYPLTRHFSNYVDEQGAYIGIPLILIVVCFGFELWRLPYAKFLVITLGVILIASLGPQLWIAGHFSGIVMPWYPLLSLPLISAAEPDRFSLYVWLIISIIVSLWLANAEGSQVRRRFLAVLLACVVIMPVLHPVQKAQNLVFFPPGPS